MAGWRRSLVSGAPPPLRRGAVAPLAAACLLMSALGTLYAWSVFVPALEADFGRSRAAVSLVFSTATLCFTLGMLLAPALEDLGTVASRGAASCVLGAAGLALAGLGDSLWLVVAGFGGLFGFANGLGYSTGLRLAQGLGRERRGLFTGLAVASYTAGSAVGAPVLAALLQSVQYRGTLLLLAGYVAVAGLLIGAITGPGEAASAGSRLREPPTSRLPSSAFWALWVYFLLNSVVGVLMIAHAAPMAASRSASAAEAALAAFLVALGNGIGRLAGGWLCDRVPARVVLCGAPLLDGVALAAAAALPGADVVLMSLFFVGTGYGCVASGLPATLGRIYPAAAVTRIYGRLFSAWGVAGIGGPLLGAAFFELRTDYEGALAAGAAVALLAASLGGAMGRFSLSSPPVGR